MLFVLSIVSLENVFSRRIISGSFVSSLVQSMDKVYSKPKNFIPPISLLDPKMNTITSNIIDRHELQEAYIESIIDGMDHKSMYQYVYDNLSDHLDKYSVDELITEVEDYYPELLE